MGKADSALLGNSKKPCVCQATFVAFSAHEILCMVPRHNGIHRDNCNEVKLSMPLDAETPALPAARAYIAPFKRIVPSSVSHVISGSVWHGQTLLLATARTTASHSLPSLLASQPSLDHEPSDVSALEAIEALSRRYRGTIRDEHGPSPCSPSSSPQAPALIPAATLPKVPY